MQHSQFGVFVARSPSKRGKGGSRSEQSGDGREEGRGTPWRKMVVAPSEIFRGAVGLGGDLRDRGADGAKGKLHTNRQAHCVDEHFGI